VEGARGINEPREGRYGESAKKTSKEKAGVLNEKREVERRAYWRRLGKGCIGAI